MIRPYRDRRFYRFILLWVGQLLSGIGSGMTAFALGIDAFQRTGAVASFSLIIVSLYLPSTVLRPFGGVLADRFNRKTLIIAGDIGGAVTLLTLAVLMTIGTPSVALVATVIAFGSVCTAIREPAYKAAVTDLVLPGQFTRAAGMMQFAAAGQHVLSPLAAGMLIAAGTLQTVLVADFATFCLAVAATSFLPAIRVGTAGSEVNVQRPRPTGILRNTVPVLVEGFSSITGNRAVGIPVLLISAVTLCVGYVQTLFPPMMLTRFTVTTLGTVQSVSAAGMIVSSVAISVISTGGAFSTDKLRRRLAGGLAVAGASIAVVGAARSLPEITIAFFLFFAALPVINTSADVLIRGSVDTDRQGRVWGTIGFLTQTGYLAAYLSAAPLADRLFEPFMSGTGAGPGRGIGLMIVVAGIGLTGTALPALTMLRSEDGPWASVKTM